MRSLYVFLAAALFMVAPATTHAEPVVSRILQGEPDDAPRQVIVDYAVPAAAMATAARFRRGSTATEAVAQLPSLGDLSHVDMKRPTVIEVMEYPDPGAMGTVAMLEYMRFAGYRPANVYECLALAGAYGATIGRGGVCLGQRLERDEGGERHLQIYGGENGLFACSYRKPDKWSRGDRFYVVRSGN